MTNQQGAPEALRLADIANSDGHITNIERNQIARELRRLHAENERLAALVEAQQPAPSAAGVKPECYRWERYDKWVNGWGWGDCESEYDPRLPENKQYHSEDFNDPEEVRNFRALYRNAPQHSLTPQADSQPAPVRDYPPLPDLGDGSKLWCAIGRHHRAITAVDIDKAAKAVDEAAIALLLSYVDADRTMRTQANSQPAPVRCPACSYQHGHAIGCENNPVDISLAAQAPVAARAPADSVMAPAGGWHPFPHYLQNPDGRLLRTSADLLERHGYTGCSTPLRRMADALLNEPAAPTTPAQAADSVLEDAARLLESQHTWITNAAAANLVRSFAARKQGANHD